MDRSLKSRAAIGLTSLALMALPGCGNERSVEAFCGVHDEYKARYLAAFEAFDPEASGPEVIANLLGIGSVIGDLANMWEKLAQVAPDDISAEVDSVSTGWQKMTDKTSAMAEHPMSAGISITTTALQISGPMGRTDAYVRENCD